MIDFLLPGSTVYLVIKALHIISVIFWMAGMLYLPRLFVYHHGAARGGELEAALLKQERNLLKIIINPAMIAVWVLALLMIAANMSLWTAGWLHVKLVLVILLSAVHGLYASAAKKFAAGERPRTEKFWRIVNEIPALMVIAIVLLAVLKPF
ncbi:protoporphyrinogen oxidase HemJ [Hyphobacterium marinum]|uniref:Protoporphyrinogen IX oxidase n=1 Tax=Hyphobacterium marinum TaxID=3116574 RepID=A0ABU7LUY9_9PROT|nr:protoporphyrinogen oxidase HemJ [Hyphobacterium sp. Y6023]MEE2565373.1 protoporphyrinogen oxidase HemJ [Hyphobacterium sp. Y6023]